MLQKSRRSVLLIILAVAAVLIGAAVATAIRTRTEIETEYEAALTQLEREYRSILTVYENSARILLEILTSQEAVVESVAAAANARREALSHGEAVPTGTENAARADLQLILAPFYERLTRYRFRQLHIHMPDSSSFLRMHSKDRFGDSLVGVRSTVERANADRTYVSGFEEGRIFNGYRFVQPISDSAGEHVGTVEIGISFATIIDDLRSLFSGTYQFVVHRAVVERKVFESEREEYGEWSFSSSFLTDPEVPEPTELYTLAHTFASESLVEEVDRRVRNFERFATHFQENGTYYIAAFVPVRNFDDVPVGYFIAIESSPALLASIITKRRYLALYGLSAILFGAMGFVLVRRDRQLEQLATRDQLTGLYNRYLFVELFDRARKEQKRTGEGMALAMLDLDRFKSINDRYGHSIGDTVLCAVAEQLSSRTRPGDVVSRWGGEEFVILLRDVSGGQCGEIAEKLRGEIEELHLPDIPSITISIGIVPISPGDEQLDELIGAADTLLYRAKENGRNRVEMHS